MPTEGALRDQVLPAARGPGCQQDGLQNSPLPAGTLPGGDTAPGGGEDRNLQRKPTTEQPRGVRTHFRNEFPDRESHSLKLTSEISFSFVNRNVTKDVEKNARVPDPAGSGCHGDRPEPRGKHRPLQRAGSDRRPLLTSWVKSLKPCH